MSLRDALDALVKDNLAPEAEARMLQSMSLLSYEARAEAAHRVAFAYYVLRTRRRRSPRRRYLAGRRGRRMGGAYGVGVGPGVMASE